MMTPMRSVESSVTADGVPRFKVRFRLDRRETSRTFLTHKAAVDFARLIDDVGVAEAARIFDEQLGADHGTPSLTAWAGEHIDSLSGVQDDTLKRYRAYVANDLGTLGPLPITAITPEAVSRWVNKLAASGASGKTIKNKHGFLSATLEHAVLARLIPSNPCKGTRLPRTVTEPMVFLTHDEYARFLGYVVPHWQPLVTTLFSTGLRWAEATALRVGDVDLEQATIGVTRAWKEGRVIGAPKSKRSRRTISLAPETVELLRPLVDGRPADEWLFTNMRGGPVRHQTFHDNVWQPAVRLANGEPAQRPGPKAKRVARRRDAAGAVIAPAGVWRGIPWRAVPAPLGKRPRIHDARHTCASWLLGDNVPVNVVQAHLGHESIVTTSDRYGHIMPAARYQVMNAMSRALSQAHPTIEPDPPLQIEP